MGCGIYSPPFRDIRVHDFGEKFLGDCGAETRKQELSCLIISFLMVLVN